MGGTIQDEIGTFIPGIDMKMEPTSQISVAQAELNFVNLYPKAIQHFHATMHRGEQLKIITDLFTSPGVFLVVHESEQECEAAIQAVRKAERAMLARAIGETLKPDSDSDSDSDSLRERSSTGGA